MLTGNNKFKVLDFKPHDKTSIIVGGELRLFVDRDDVDTRVVDALAESLCATLNDVWGDASVRRYTELLTREDSNV